MLEKIHGIPARIERLKAKLAARTGKMEYAENVEHIRREIARLEALSMNREALEEFVAGEAGAVASDPVKD